MSSLVALALGVCTRSFKGRTFKCITYASSFVSTVTEVLLRSHSVNCLDMCPPILSMHSWPHKGWYRCIPLDTVPSHLYSPRFLSVCLNLLCDRHQCFGGNSRLCLQGRRASREKKVDQDWCGLIFGMCSLRLSARTPTVVRFFVAFLDAPLHMSGSIRQGSLPPESFPVPHSFTFPRGNQKKIAYGFPFMPFRTISADNV
jgi:hypothetical protein